MTVRERIREARHTVGALLVGLATWELAGRALHYTFLPPFSSVVRAALDMIASGEVIEFLAASLVGLLIGYALASVCGVAFGLLMGHYSWFGFVMEPLLNAFLTAPTLVYVPVLCTIFGIGRGAQVSIVFLSAFFVVAINTMSGIRGVGGNCVEMARAFGATDRQLFWKVLLPGALPMTMAGLRLGVGRAVRGMITGEMFIAFSGLGALLQRYGNSFDSERVFATLLVAVGVALLCSFAVGEMERRLLVWMDQIP